MASGFTSTFQNIWHSLTSNDRHADYNSPFNTGQHVPLSQSSRNAPLTSVATDASESRQDLAAYGDDDNASRRAMLGHQWGSSPPSATSPYSPGMRSSIGRAPGDSPFDALSGGEIQMQNFQEGLPPPPPVMHSWKKIDRWAEDNYPELFDQLSEGCTVNDLNELEHELDCSLPMDVRESLMVHDGQERGGMPTGIIISCMLLDCEEIVDEWRNWRTVNEEFIVAPLQNQPQPQPPTKAFGGASSSKDPAPASDPLWRQNLLARQDSQPPNSVQRAYAHPAWIPLARDWGGNNLAVDLSPGPMGKWGQIIIFGRDYDCKYVVARSWAAFLAMVADDITSDKIGIDEDSGDMKLKIFTKQNVEPPYLDILRWRVDQKFGRKGPKRRSKNGLGLNTTLKAPTNGDSPYHSPNDMRGRSPSRFNGRGPGGASPKNSPKNPHGSASSPLARVAEEASSPVSTHSGNKEKLVEVATPRMSSELKSPASSKSDSKAAATPTEDSDKENLSKTSSDSKEELKEKEATGLGMEGLEGLRNVEI